MFRQGMCLAFQVMLAVCLAGPLNVPLIHGYTFSRSQTGPAEERIVYPRLLEGRGLNGEKMLYIQDGLTLSLQKSRVFAENLVLTVDDGVTETYKILRGENLGNNLYHDKQGTAALQVEEANGTVQVTGFLEHTLAIEPLPLIARSGDGRIAHELSEIDYEAQDRPPPPSYPPPPPFRFVDVAVNGIRQVKNFVKRFDSDPSRVPLTRELLRAVQQSHKTYSERLQREAEDRERRKREALTVCEPVTGKKIKLGEEKLYLERCLESSKAMLERAQGLIKMGLRHKSMDGIESGQVGEESSLLHDAADVGEKLEGIGTVNVDQFQPRGFSGYESISSHDEHSEVLKDLTGVSAACFAVLLGMLTQENYAPPSLLD
ncbi:hypothetical protein HPB47_025761 [Ixodes persulcatus]|uniref:Uncharacterized protein n=1 Tax=Ixodes persulcatus TaxID=34615 RepID=A0AC60Q0M9_IXOPE|nr:hypothetical protein HPB47_025761 [Ixodes persulcatus]